MANFLYTNAKYLMLTGQFDWVNDPITVVLVASGQYEPSVNHATLLDIPVSARVAVSGTLSGRTVSSNVVDADNYLFASVSGPTVSSAVLVVNSGTEASSWLLCHLDDAITGLPFNPTTGTVQLTWDNGLNKVFAL